MLEPRMLLAIANQQATWCGAILRAGNYVRGHSRISLFKFAHEPLQLFVATSHVIKLALEVNVRLKFTRLVNQSVDRFRGWQPLWTSL